MPTSLTLMLTDNKRLECVFYDMYRRQTERVLAFYKVKSAFLLFLFRITISQKKEAKFTFIMYSHTYNLLTSNTQTTICMCVRECVCVFRLYKCWGRRSVTKTKSQTGFGSECSVNTKKNSQHPYIIYMNSVLLVNERSHSCVDRLFINTANSCVRISRRCACVRDRNGAFLVISGWLRLGNAATPVRSVSILTAHTNGWMIVKKNTHKIYLFVYSVCDTDQWARLRVDCKFNFSIIDQFRRT